jgi:hypothetical protein
MNLQNISIKAKDLKEEVLNLSDLLDSLLKTQQELKDALSLSEGLTQEEMIDSYTNVFLEKFLELQSSYRRIIDKIDNIGM